MRLIAAGTLAGLGAVLALTWALGGFQALGWWAAERQRDLQTLLGGQIHALRAGDRAALWSLMGICAAYGFVHALGPGHGKALVTGAAVATRATAARMATIAVLGSLAQALVAIVIVFGALSLLAATARGTVDTVDRWAAPISNAAIAVIGAWFLWRGLRALRIPATARPPACGCGHDHGPSLETTARATGPGAALALIGGMAARPCTGALFVLVIAWRLELAAAGVAAVVAMGLGTAAFSVIVAVLVVMGREAAYLGAGDGRAARLLAPGLQIAAGGLIVAIGGALAISQWPG